MSEVLKALSRMADASTVKVMNDMLSDGIKVVDCYMVFAEEKPVRPGEYLCTDGTRRVIAVWGTTWEGTPFEGPDWVPESLPAGWMPGQITHWQELGPLHAHGFD